jgi:hypothetical protein
MQYALKYLIIVATKRFPRSSRFIFYTDLLTCSAIHREMICD